MSELSKCPCGYDATIKSRPCGCDATYFWGQCTYCGIAGRLRNIQEGAIVDWNQLCEEIRVGREMVGVMPDGWRFVRMGAPVAGNAVFNQCNPKQPIIMNEGWEKESHIIIEPIPQPLSKDDGLSGMCDCIIESLEHVIDGGRAKADYEVLHAALVMANELQAAVLPDGEEEKG